MNALTPPCAPREPIPRRKAPAVLRALAARRAILVPALAVCVLALAAFALRHFLAETDYHAMVAAFLGVSPWRLAAALAATAVSFGVLTLYDWNAFAAIGAPRRWREVAPGAVAAFAVSQTIGFGPLTGGAVRARFYLPLGATPGQIARVVAFVTAGFGLGLIVTSAAAALIASEEAASVSGVSTGAVRGVALAILALAALVVWRGGRRVRLFGVAVAVPARATLLTQLAVTAADVAATALALWVLLPAGAISYPAFLPVFAVAVALGVASHVPAGLGVFEAVVIGAIGGAAPAVPVADIAAALALYRLIYHAAPLALAAIGLSAAEALRFSRDPATLALGRATAGLAPQALSALALLLGAMLVLSGVTPATPEDLDWLTSILPLPAVESAHFLASVMGVVLMISARGLAYRLQGARRLALGAATAAIVLSIAKAFAAYEAAALTLFVLLLFASRRRFSRRVSVRDQMPTWRWALALCAVLSAAAALLLFVYGHAEFGIQSWTKFETMAEAPRGLRALVGAAMLAGAIGLWTLYRPHPLAPAAPTPDDLSRAAAIVALQAAPDAALARSGDKSLLFSDEGDAFIMYAVRNRSWIALFDPVGPQSAWPALIWRFLETARAAGGRAVFYEVRAEHLSYYADAGLACLKLGEEARVDLSAFSLEGKSRKDQRYVLARGAREGLSLDILAGATLEPAMDELEAISAAWLGARGGREKRFSLGAFSRDYVAAQRVAVVRDGARIIAFATLLETARREEAAIDLMRHRDDVPGVTMEFLFLSLIVRLQAEEARWFSLGMAPLSGLSLSEAAPIWQRFGRVLFEHGARSYNFKGLRAFKSGFQPDWRPRYLAVAGGLQPALALIDVTRLINGRSKDANR